ncbi:MAG: serine hydrolase [Burkholderiales bacterium]|nr:serine hydrolase [Burkholderiales bacterium]
MGRMGRLAFWSGCALAVGLAAVAVWLHAWPPALVRVGAAHAAKTVCSGVFVAGRDAAQVLRDDVVGPGHPLFALVRVDVDRRERVVRAGLLGFAGAGLAVARDGTGCAGVPDGDIAAARAHRSPGGADGQASAAPWPAGEGTAAPDAAIQALLADDRLAGPGMRAVLVVRDGRIVGERYGAGFDARVPLLGWSMTKTVNAVLFGLVARERRGGADRPALLSAWHGDARRQITAADLLAMSSGLAFDERYGSVSDVTRMLFLEPDMAGYAAARPLQHPVGTVFSYASGTSVLLARLWQDALADPARALGYPREALFGPLGMRSAVLEADARGTFVGSSYMHATARDWARFALLLLEDGRWQGVDLLPPGFVAMLRAPAPAADGRYGRGQVWLHGPRSGTPPGVHADAGFDLPADTYWMLGHDGQSVALVPSRRLALVRLGLTPARLGYKPQALLQALLRLPAGNPAPAR